MGGGVVAGQVGRGCRRAGGCCGEGSLTVAQPPFLLPFYRLPCCLRSTAPRALDLHVADAIAARCAGCLGLAAAVHLSAARRCPGTSTCTQRRPKGGGRRAAPWGLSPPCRLRGPDRQCPHVGLRAWSGRPCAAPPWSAGRPLGHRPTSGAPPASGEPLALPTTRRSARRGGLGRLPGAAAADAQGHATRAACDAAAWPLAQTNAADGAEPCPRGGGAARPRPRLPPQPPPCAVAAAPAPSTTPTAGAAASAAAACARAAACGGAAASATGRHRCATTRGAAHAVVGDRRCGGGRARLHRAGPPPLRWRGASGARRGGRGAVERGCGFFFFLVFRGGGNDGGGGGAPRETRWPRPHQAVAELPPLAVRRHTTTRRPTPQAPPSRW